MDVFRFVVTFQRVSDSVQNDLETCCVVVRTCAAALVFLVGTRSRRSRSAVVLRRQGAIRSEEGAHAKSLEFAASRGLAPVSGNGPAAVQSAHDAGHARERFGRRSAICQRHAGAIDALEPGRHRVGEVRAARVAPGAAGAICQRELTRETGDAAGHRPYGHRGATRESGRARRAHPAPVVRGAARKTTPSPNSNETVTQLTQ